MYIAIVLASLMTMLMWLPYFMGEVSSRGLTLILSGDPKSDTKVPPAWVKRLRQAHGNALENLPIFIAVCFAAELTQSSTELMVTAAMVYCVARVAHYLLYGLAVPFLRTMAFMGGWLATLYIGLMTLQNVI